MPVAHNPRPGIASRRQFLKTSGESAIASIAWAAAGSPSAAAAQGTDLAHEPRLLTGCCAYSFRKYLGAKQMTMEDFVRKGVELRCHAVDMTGYWWTSTEPPYIAGLRHLAQKNGMAFSGAACGASMVQADAGKRAEVAAEIRKWIDATELLGAPHLRIFGGKLPAGATTAQALDWCVELMRPACDYAAAKGITVGVENHDGVTQHADLCLELMRRVDSPYAGINLDITHFIGTADEDPYRQIEACVPYATHTHIRDRFDNREPIDLDRVWKLFTGAGYKGYMSVEYEGEEDPMTGVPKLLAQVRALNQKYSSV